METVDSGRVEEKCVESIVVEHPVLLAILTGLAEKSGVTLGRFDYISSVKVEWDWDEAAWRITVEGDEG